MQFCILHRFSALKNNLFLLFCFNIETQTIRQRFAERKLKRAKKNWAKFR